MLSKAQNKHIRSLAQQKFRDQHRQFVAEGHKIATEWLSGPAPITMVVATNQWLKENASLLTGRPNVAVIEAAESDMAAISQLKSAPSVLVVVSYPEQGLFSFDSGWCIALDGIQDPGNLGTIIRIADWFGVKSVLCSMDCVDAYNHKVVQGAMGSHLRVDVRKVDLAATLSNAGVPLYVASLSGTSVYDTRGVLPGVLVIGSEGRGVSPEVLGLGGQLITIPRIGEAESLNAAVSTGILCSWLVPR
ncbi:MAG: RNA methyltransferase [Taibaiella sp.]|nr:RNA methyltransferase [Taibaiella sp.]